VVVRYAYTVQGQEYEGARDDLSYFSNDQKAVQVIVARYQVGASVPVCYDPQALQRALIERSIRSKSSGWSAACQPAFPIAGSRRLAGDPDRTGDAGSAGTAASRLSKADEMAILILCNARCRCYPSSRRWVAERLTKME
jgi:hypothetical protein